MQAQARCLFYPRSLSDYAEIYCAAGIAAQNRLNMRRIEPLCSLYSSNFDLTSPPAHLLATNCHSPTDS
jgi:hypothetical protein